jgi:localization factor PodJL
MAGGPWSVKGIAPQAREAAKDAARREGKTLGEWLNEIILETGDDAVALRADAPTIERESQAPASPRETLDALARRLEAAEHRSTLAITGIDQSVRGLISRLEATEQTAGESVSELYNAHSELARRLEALEADTSAETGLQAVKALEDAIARVAGHVHERDRKSTDQAGGLEQRLADLDARFVKTADDLARRIDAASDHAAMQAQRTTGDLRATVETNQARTIDALASLETTVGRITERLSTAEGLTDNAVRSLEASFAHLDDRLRRTESQAEENPAQDIAATLEQKFEALGRELRERIDAARAETAQSIETASPRLDRLEHALQTANQRHARTLARIGQQIDILGAAVERRLDESERRLREDAIQDRALDTRLREVENSSAEAIRKVAESVEQISLRLTERIEGGERRNNEAAATLGREMARLAERLGSAALDDDTLAARLRESERRTQQMIRDAVAGVSAKLDVVRDEAESGLSPVQSALANLAGRLEAIENGQVSATPARDERDQWRRSSLPPAEEVVFSLAEDANIAETAAEPEEEIAIAPQARPNPFIDMPDEEVAPNDYISLDEQIARDEEIVAAASALPDAAAWPPMEPPAADLPEFDLSEPAATAEPGPGFTPEPAPAPESVYVHAPREPFTPQPLGVTADSGFLAAARQTARSAPETIRARRASVLETSGEERSGNGRRVLLLAGALAIVTLGGAAYLLFQDGMPFGDGGARLAGELEDPAVSSVIDGAPAQGTVTTGAAPAAPVQNEAQAAAALREPAAEIAVGETGAPPADVTDAADVEATQNAAPAGDAAAAPAETSEAPAESQTPATPAPAAQAPAASAAQAESAPTPEARIVSGAPDTAAQSTILSQPAPQPAAPAAAAGAADPVALFQLGERELQSGNPEEGARLIRSGATQGYPPAQYRLGKLYEAGVAGVPQDDVQARLWTERAAVAGNRNAMHNLGLMYAEGRGVEQNDQLAAQWFERAAMAGATDSQFNLAVLYEQGRGVPQSLAHAYAWYRIAERSGDVEAGERANMVATQISDNEAAEAQQSADAFVPRALDPFANGATP